MGLLCAEVDDARYLIAQLLSRDDAIDVAVLQHVFCSCDAMICVGGNDDQLGGTVPECLVIANPSNRGSTVTWCSEPGAIYLILVSGFSANTGNFDLSISDDGMECGMDAKLKEIFGVGRAS